MKKGLLLLIWMGFHSGVFAQKDTSEHAAIREVIWRLFEGMKNGDSSLVRSCFTENPVMYSRFLHPRTKQEQLVRETLSDFLKAVGTPHTETWNEIPSGIVIQADGSLLATAWVPYTFYLNENYLHEGVDAFQLIREQGTWKILVLTDTRRSKKP